MEMIYIKLNLSSIIDVEYIEIHGDVYLMYMLRSHTCDPRGDSMIYA